ncbi:hypothetical protein Tco_0252692 [Tanacetum coccineum]
MALHLSWVSLEAIRAVKSCLGSCGIANLAILQLGKIVEGEDDVYPWWNWGAGAFKRQKVEDDKETAELKQCMEIIPDEEEVAIDAIPSAIKSPSIIGWKIYKEERKRYYQIMRADGKSQMYSIFSHMLKSFDRKDLEDLYKLVKAKYESTRPVEDLDLLLWGDLKIMF